MGVTYVDVAGEVAAHVALSDGEVETVHFTRTEAEPPFFTPNPIAVVEIINRGTAEVWYTTDGSTPTVSGSNCYALPAGAADVRDMPSRQTNTVHLICDGMGLVSVQRVN